MPLARFASDEWLNVLEQEIQIYARRAFPNDRFSLCEVYSAVPASLSSAPGGRVAWTLRVDNGSVCFIRREASDVDLKVESSYPTIAEIARTPVGPDNADEYAERTAELIQERSIRLIGDPTVIGHMQEFHNIIASMTI